MEHETPRDAWRQWEANHASAVIDSVNHVRAARGISLRRLAELLEGVGWPVGFGTLAGILSTKKRAGISVGEIFAFARALDVPPGYLLTGLPSARVPDLPVLPQSLTAGEVLAWVVGERQLGGESPRDDVTASAAMALSDALGLARLVAYAGQLNDLVIAAQTFKPGQLDGLFHSDILDGAVLRETLKDIRRTVLDGGRGDGVLRPGSPPLQAPWAVAADERIDLDELELPLPMPEGHDVSTVRAMLSQMLAEGPRNRSRVDPVLPGTEGVAGA